MTVSAFFNYPLRDKPLQWWNLNEHVLPNLAKLAQKHLGIVATSVLSERLFHVAGNIVHAKRAALLPENVEKLFLFMKIPHYI